MTEVQWLASEDPAAMLRALDLPRELPQGRSMTPSDRKLTLFVGAIVPSGQDPAWDRWLAGDVVPGHMSAADGAMYFAGGKAGQSCVLRMTREERGRRADLLREIVGNPFHPAPSPYRECDSCCGRGQWAEGYQYETDCPDCDATGKRPEADWLTPTVLSLAHAAYEERGRECETCKGAGELKPIGNVIGCYDCSPRHGERGTGTIDNGTLDPARLAVLSDALEEAGCDNAGILSHLRQGYVVRYAFAGATGSYGTHNSLTLAEDAAEKMRRHFINMADVWVVPPIPHVRGCWVLDLLLGLE